MQFSLWRSRRKTAEKDPIEKKRRRKIRRTQALIFLGLFLIAEVVLRIVGYKPGVAQNFYYQSGEVIYDSILYADELGITHHVQGGTFIYDAPVNKEGFFSEVEYTKEAMDSIRAQGKKIIMLVGDSFTAGCCPDSYNSSYAYLLNKSDEYEVLSFGVGGTDPLHYELVVDKYLPILEPDLVAVTVYLGNDDMLYDRTAKPYIPVCYPVKNGPWLSSEAYINLRPADTHFKNFQEAKKFFYSYYSLRSEESNWFEKIIRNSIIITRGYLKAKMLISHWRMADELGQFDDKPPYSYNHLNGIHSVCKEANVPVVFTAIPSPVDLAQEINLKEQYGHMFNQLIWSSPENISIDDYDGLTTGNHYTASGHQKFAEFLRDKIQLKLK